MKKSKSLSPAGKLFAIALAIMIHVVGLYFGIYQEVTGIANVYGVFIWVVSLFVAFAGLMLWTVDKPLPQDVHDALLESSVNRVLGNCIAGTVILVLAYFGWFATTVIYSLAFVLVNTGRNHAVTFGVAEDDAEPLEA